ncbi:hypothetical protein ONA91_28760 [Micromonospora sp. DR5-3]|uniref:hypothetical protein n=1 Tax=unclassified Micromonospora TaxID=2617518 RepID=UPI0011D804A1|nr:MULTISPECIES: hypothetical protein [unclassified Micromonospora]MCW3818440.1 hypothetical protein [Micromonospora sp. DR5-3]TYC23183.1 hypothetical protein FXF52_16925 [Micromonospora sp. MP36]
MKRTTPGALSLLTAWALLAGTLIASAPVHAAPPPTPALISGAEQDLGHAINSRVLSQYQAQGVDQQGRPQAYWVTAGNSEVTAMFQVTDIRSGKVVFGERLPSGTGSWAVTFAKPQRAVYFGMTDGAVYTWSPGDTSVTALGVPFPDEQIWRMAAAPDGVIYGGTYPSGKLFSYDPATKRFTDHGQIIPGETYGQALAVDDRYVYFGTKPNAKLARFDRVTGAVQPITLPAQYADEEAVYDLTLAGGYLFARLDHSSDLLVYRLSDGTVVNIVPAISGRMVSEPDPTGRYVYFRMVAEGVVQYDLHTHTYAAVGWKPNALPGSWEWVDLADPTWPGPTLSMTYYYGRIYLWNPQTRATRYIGEQDLEGAPNPIQAMGTGPDGSVYVGGFLSPPGMARFDPAHDAMSLLAGAGQVEGFGIRGDHLLYGRYPDGNLLSFDTTRPWAYGSNPAPRAVLGDEQQRAQAFVDLGETVAVGSIPRAGRLGGALSFWTPSTGAVQTYRDVVPQQSVVSLVEHDGLLYGGTSINGGYGIEPTATEAELFVFDPRTRQVVKRVVPAPGGSALNALVVDAAGIIWGLSDGTLFTFDPATRTVTRSEQLFPKEPTMYGNERGLVAGDDGFFYASVSDSLWRIDPTTWDVVELASGRVAFLTKGGDGNLYYGRVSRLYRWNFALPAVCSRVISGGYAGQLDVTTGTTCLRDATVTGQVSVGASAALVVQDSAVDGPIRAEQAARVAVRDSAVSGPLSANGTSGEFSLINSSVTGPVTVVHGRGSSVLAGNVIEGPLRCLDNEPAPQDDGQPNTVAGPAQGQCVNL